MLELDKIPAENNIEQMEKIDGLGRNSYIRVICKGVQRKLVEKLWVLDVLEVVFPESTI